MKQLTSMEIAANRDRIISLLRSTNREGIEDVIKFLDDSLLKGSVTNLK